MAKRTNSNNHVSTGHTPAPIPPGPMSAGQVPPSGMYPTMAMVPPATGDTGKKGKKGKNTAALTQEQLAMLSPEQLTQLQMEEAIKESQNPGMRLKKLRSPLSLRSCLLNLLFFVILTLAITMIVVMFWPGLIDRPDFVHVINDMWTTLGLRGVFATIGNWFSNLFTGCGDGEAVLSWAAYSGMF